MEEDAPHKHAAAVTIQKKSRQRAARKKVAVVRQLKNDPVPLVEPVYVEPTTIANEEQSLDSLQQDEPVGFAASVPEEQPIADTSAKVATVDTAVADPKAQLPEAEPALDDIVYDDEQKAVALMIQKRARKRQSSKAKEAAKGSAASGAVATTLLPTIETEPTAATAADGMASPASTDLPSGTSTEVSLTDTADDAPPSPCDNTLGAVEIVLDSEAMLDNNSDIVTPAAAAAEQNESNRETVTDSFNCETTVAAAAPVEHAASDSEAAVDKTAAAVIPGGEAVDLATAAAEISAIATAEAAEAEKPVTTAADTTADDVTPAAPVSTNEQINSTDAPVDEQTHSSSATDSRRGSQSSETADSSVPKMGGVLRQRAKARAQARARSSLDAEAAAQAAAAVQTGAVSAVRASAEAVVSAAVAGVAGNVSEQEGNTVDSAEQTAAASSSDAAAHEQGVQQDVHVAAAADTTVVAAAAEEVTAAVVVTATSAVTPRAELSSAQRIHRSLRAESPRFPSRLQQPSPTKLALKAAAADAAVVAAIAAAASPQRVRASAAAHMPPLTLQNGAHHPPAHSAGPLSTGRSIESAVSQRKDAHKVRASKSYCVYIRHSNSGSV
jgi:hypothetical protein